MLESKRDYYAESGYDPRVLDEISTEAVRKLRRTACR
jgi:hypothetical protein